ncbi:MAG TPA: 50S rRNA methyltransferase [Verrucomicrobiales bacterium]|nr:50S rRNA methyltransferase [Roseibacillus sp.]HBM78065.1 50S rRNA methyltransferase [Verrucomicrobiales bacterium]HCQ38153.1 50S rRNA methyltransferase [Verrucomicrobiales bacterium]
MKLRILAIGKPKLGYAGEGVREYTGRLKHYVPLDLEFLKGHDESSSLLAKSEGSYRIALDERGSQLTTLGISDGLTRLENRPGIKKVVFLIGGAAGHSPALRDQCDEIWSLSTMTMQHELALVVLLEQIYRAYTIKRGEPYHRA